MVAAVADARFHSLAYMVDDAIVVVDGSNVVRFANPSADRLLEQPPGALVGQPFVLLLAQSKSGLHALSLASGRRQEVMLTVSATVWDGAVAWMASLKPVLGAVTDGAEAVETLLGAMRARFLAHLSHELRTPLNTVMGFSEAMLAELMGPLGHPRYRAYAHDIHRAGSQLLGLVTDLLDLSRADSGGLELDESLFDLPALLAEVLPQAQSTALRAQGAVVSAGPIDPVLLRGDREKLHRALLHLVSNGLAFTPAGGTVTISSDITDDGRVRIRVADTGRGFSAEELSNAFRPFPRIRTVEQADPRAGPGVGLALVRRYMELHGGAVRIESAPGVGTTVTCMLPSDRVALDLVRPVRH